MIPIIKRSILYYSRPLHFHEIGRSLNSRNINRFRRKTRNKEILWKSVSIWMERLNLLSFRLLFKHFSLFFYSSLLFSLTPFVLLTNIVQTSWLSTSYYIFPCYSRLLDTICSLFHARSEFQTGFSESGTATRKYLFGSSFKKWFVSMFFFSRGKIRIFLYLKSISRFLLWYCIYNIFV